MPFAFVAMGIVVLCLSGCRKENEQSAEAPTHTPASYMNDPAFRKQLADKRKELQAIIAERAPLVARMEELVRSNRADLAVLQKIPEWNELHKKVVALNAKYEETRQRQLKIVRERVQPKSEKKVSK